MTTNPENIPADIAKVEKDVATLRGDNTTLYGDAEAADTALTADAATIASQTAELATDAAEINADTAEIAELEAELNNTAPVWTADTPPAGTVGQAYTYTFAASGNPAPTFTFSGVPAGLAPNGATLSGTPTTAGSGVTIVTATNAAGTVSASVTIVIAPATVTPPPTTIPLPFTPEIGPIKQCVLADLDFLGIHYMPTPTITLGGQNAAQNGSGLANSAKALGATAWAVVDSAGNCVATGPCAATDINITVCTNGKWVGGSTAVPGHYTVFTNNGTNGVVPGNVVICPPTNLYVPPTQIGGSGNAAEENLQDMSFSAWLGGAPDRDYYAVPGQTVAQVVANRAEDAYFTGPQDPARPRKMWIAPSPQATSPTQNPTAAQWGQYAAALVAAGHPGCWYECPTNEPENGGWSITAIIAYWQACSAAIIAADPTAHVMGWDSAGIYANSPITAVAAFLAACHPAAITNHMENSHQNMGDFVELRQYLGGIKAQFAASGVPTMDLWLTETGIEGGQYGVVQPRREARQRTLLRFVAESYGWAKENCYDFPPLDHQGSGLPMYLVDKLFGNGSGNMRAGAYALHVQSEALYGTSCTPTNIPAKLNFGPAGAVGDSLFMGLHYTGTHNDVVVLATNGITGANVTLDVSAAAEVTYWNGMGVPAQTAVTNGQITVPVDDLLTYVFLPTGSTVSVVDTDQGAVALSTAPNLALGATVVNEAGTAVPSVHNGSFAENNSGIAGIPTPYTDSTFPATLTVTLPAATEIVGFALKTPDPAWQTIGCGLVDYTVEIDGNVVYTFTDPTAFSLAVPSPSNGNSSDDCTRTTWWRSPFGAVRKLPSPVTGTVVKLTVTATGYGGEPDLAASQDSNSAYNENSPMSFQLAELQVFGA